MVYDGCDCGDLVLLGCNDDDPINPCGDPMIYQSTITVPMVGGSCYLIRVGGFQIEGVDKGSGTLLIDPLDPQCGACCQGDTCIDNQGPEECEAADGVFQGVGSACDPDLCGVGCEDCVWDVFPIDGVVSAGDLAFLLGGWGPIPPDADPLLFCLDTDFNNIISAPDLANLLGNWGPCE